MNDRKKLLVFFAVSFLVIGSLIFYIFRPLLNTILLGFVFTFLFYPIHKRLTNLIKRPRLSAFMICFLFILIITIPVLFAINALAGEIFSVSDRLTDASISGVLNLDSCSEEINFCRLVRPLLENNVIKRAGNDLLVSGITGAKKYVGNVLIAIPSFILQVFIIIFMMYYTFIDGHLLMNKIKKILPISEKHKKQFFDSIERMLGGILYGSIVVGVIQGILGGFGFFIFGVKAPILWGIIMFFFSFIPFLGTGIVWFPASAYIIINSAINHDNLGIFRGIGLIIYCTLFVSTIDNFIRPKLVSNRTKIHPVLVLFGVLGGLSVFNIAGVIIGPLLLGIFLTLLDMFEKENYNRKRDKK